MLAYLMGIGKHERNIAKQAMLANEPLPESIANAPELILGLELYLQAFFDLDSTRNGGDLLSPISWLSIKEYAMTFSFDVEQTESLFAHIRGMDISHIERVSKQHKAKQKPNK